MATYAYTVHIDGATRIGEVEAGDEAEARKLANTRHTRDGYSVTVNKVFRPPSKLGTPREIATMPTPQMRVNYHRDLYEPRIRKERGRVVHR